MKGCSAIYCSCRGESHVKSGKPCQDCSLAESKGRYAMAIVSDGHGGPRYFRSDKGSEVAVKITREMIKAFIREREISSKIKGAGTFGTDAELTNKKDDIYINFRKLVSAIITHWNREIAEDARNRPLTDWERENVEERYLQGYEAALQSESPALETTYGCTLMAFVMTKDYWFAFQIGDGRMLFFINDDDGDDGGRIRAVQPVPWDDRCFLNRTTSLCDSEAVSEFRFAYSALGDSPVAVFLGSDGIDDTYGDGDRLTDFYIRLYKETVLTRHKKVRTMLEADLPVLSRIGSKDDMSIAFVYRSDREFMKRNFLLMSAWQREKLAERLNVAEEKIVNLRKKIDGFGDAETLTGPQKIELMYAAKDLERVSEEKSNLQKSLEKIEQSEKKLTAVKKSGKNLVKN